MSAAPCTGLIDEARVSVDTGLLERAAFPSPILALALLLCLVGLVLAIRAAPKGHRGWSLFTLLAPIGPLIAWLSLQQRTELTFSCVVEPSRIAARLVTIAAGIGSVAFLQLCVTLTLRAWKRELRVLWPIALLSASLALSGPVSLHKGALLKDFSQRVRAVMPAPNVRPPETPPEAHLERTLVFKPEVQAAGRVTGLLFTSRVLLGDEAARRWGVETVALTPKAEGLTSVPLHLQQDLVSVDAELQVRGVRDEGPGFLPLAKGNRWEFVAVHGRGGALERLRSGITRGKKPIPKADITLEVTGEGERDGFHFFELTDTRDGVEPVVHRVVRRDGQLLSEGTRVAWLDHEHCQVRLLDPSWCTCTEDRITECRVVSGDLGETFLRLFLGAVTLGITEIQGMGDLGVGNEAGLLLTRWVVNGQSSSVRNAPSP